MENRISESSVASASVPTSFVRCKPIGRGIISTSYKMEPDDNRLESLSHAANFQTGISPAHLKTGC
jgi:hypothetical protein